MRAGLVLFRFAVVAALSGTFSLGRARSWVSRAGGGGWSASWSASSSCGSWLLDDDYLVITVAVIAG